MREAVSWEEEVEERVRGWLAELPAPPAAPFGDGGETPDLLSFYEALCALRSDFRTSARRSNDAFGRFNEELEGLREFLSDLTGRLEKSDSDRGGKEERSRRKLVMGVAELHDRIGRLEDHMSEPCDVEPPPRPGFWRRVAQAFAHVFLSRPIPCDTPAPEGQGEAARLVRLHAEAVLAGEGVRVVDPIGMRFDPARMRAVGVDAIPGAPEDTVVAVVARGYETERGDVLRYADVVINRGESET